MCGFRVHVDQWPRRVRISLGSIEVTFSFYSSDELEMFKREIANLGADDLEKLKRDIEKVE